MARLRLVVQVAVVVELIALGACAPAGWDLEVDGDVGRVVAPLECGLVQFDVRCDSLGVVIEWGPVDGRAAYTIRP